MAGGQGWESLSRKRPDSFQDFIPGLNNTLADLGPWQPIGGTNCNFYKIMPRNKTPDFAADYFGKFTVPLFWHSNSNLAVFSLLPPVSFPSSWSECDWVWERVLNTICEQSKWKENKRSTVHSAISSQFSPNKPALIAHFTHKYFNYN